MSNNGYMLYGTTAHVKQWREQVIEHYGSMVKFNDQRSTNMMLGFLDAAIKSHDDIADTIYDQEDFVEFNDVFAVDYQACCKLQAQLCEDVNDILLAQREAEKEPA